jgi:PAS domain-containing protein
LIRGNRLSGRGGDGGHDAGSDSLVSLVKRTRRISIIIILLLAFAYVRLIGDSYTLAQFAPAIVGGLYWQRGNVIGTFAGLLFGFIVWAYTLLIPSFAESGWISRDFIDHGLFGISTWQPYSLFGWNSLDHVSHGLFWSLLVNVGTYLAGAFCFTQKEDQLTQARIFVNIHEASQNIPRTIMQGLYWRDLNHLLGLFVGAQRAQNALATYALARNLTVNPENQVDADFLDYVEKLLTGSVGSSMARVVVAAKAKERHGSAETMQLLSSASAQIEIQWSRLREAIDNIDQGISMFDGNLKLLVWNQRYLELLEYPDSFGAIDTPLEQFFRHNA